MRPRKQHQKILTVKPNKKVKYYTTETIAKKSLKNQYSNCKFFSRPGNDRDFARKMMKAEMDRTRFKHTKQSILLQIYGEGIILACSLIAQIQCEAGETVSPVISSIQTEQVS